ncbi:hypothetical protein IJ182_00760 [bacterium]|nr:hypothetical protein [bacterium]
MKNFFANALGGLILLFCIVILLLFIAFVLIFFAVLYGLPGSPALPHITLPICSKLMSSELAENDLIFVLMSIPVLTVIYFPIHISIYRYKEKLMEKELSNNDKKETNNEQSI